MDIKELIEKLREGASDHIGPMWNLAREAADALERGLECLGGDAYNDPAVARDREARRAEDYCRIIMDIGELVDCRKFTSVKDNVRRCLENAEKDKAALRERIAQLEAPLPLPNPRKILPCTSCGEFMSVAAVDLFKGYCHACTASAAIVNQNALAAALTRVKNLEEHIFADEALTSRAAAEPAGRPAPPKPAPPPKYAPQGALLHLRQEPESHFTLLLEGPGTPRKALGLLTTTQPEAVLMQLNVGSIRTCVAEAVSTTWEKGQGR